MAFAIPTEFVALERTIHGSRAAMLEGYIHLIRRLDEQAHWALIVGKAREAGLQKEELCCELSCSWSTITRWMAGQTMPGPFARRRIKDKLIEMLEELRGQEMLRAERREFA